MSALPLFQGQLVWVLGILFCTVVSPIERDKSLGLDQAHLHTLELPTDRVRVRIQFLIYALSHFKIF